MSFSKTHFDNHSYTKDIFQPFIPSRRKDFSKKEAQVSMLWREKKYDRKNPYSFGSDFYSKKIIKGENKTSIRNEDYFNIKINSIDKIDDLIEYCESKIQEFSGINIARMISKLGILAGKEDRQRVEKFILRIKGNIIWCVSPRKIGLIARAFSKLGIKDEELLAALSQETLKKIAKFRPNDLAWIASSFATLEIKDEKLFKGLANETLKKIAKFKPYDLTRMLSTFSIFGNKNLFNLLVNETLRKLAEFRPPSLTMMSRTLTTLEITDKKQLNAFAMEVLKKLLDFHPEHLVDILTFFETYNLHGKTQVQERAIQLGLDLSPEPHSIPCEEDLNPSEDFETEDCLSAPSKVSNFEWNGKRDYLIDTKYLENHYDSSKRVSTKGASFPWLHNPSFSLKPVGSFYPGKEIVYESKLNSDGLKVRYLSRSDKLPQPTECCTFLILGRGEKGLIPMPSVGHRTILIVEPKQADEMMKYVGPGLDVLVVDAADGFSPDLLGRPTVRRLAALTYARYLRLDHMLMADDNLEHFFLSAQAKTRGSTTWFHIFDVMKEACQKGGLVTVTARTFRPEFCKERPDGKLMTHAGKIGSKLFMIDMKTLTHCKSLKTLLPPDPTLWGEDLFFQLALQKYGEKIGVIDYRALVFTRSKKNKNSCQKKVTFADAWLKIQDVWPHSGEKITSFQGAIINEIQTIIKNSNRKWEEKIASQKKVKPELRAPNVPAIGCQEGAVDRDLEVALSSLAHCLRTLAGKAETDTKNKKTNIATGSLVPETGYDLQKVVLEFKERLKGLLLDTKEGFQLRNGQIKGFKALLSKLPNEIGYMGYFDMFTGSGKSIMIYTLANLFMDCKSYSKNILIVTPRIALVEQLSEEYRSFCKQTHINPKSFVTISSAATTGQEICALNSWKNGSSIGFCCTKTLENYPELLLNSPVVIVDEFHTFQNEGLLEKLQEYSKKGAIVLQFSATPPKDAKGELIFKYSRNDARNDQVVAPCVYHNLDIEPNNEASVKAFIRKLPSFLKTHHHPHGGTLCENRGIIFAPFLRNSTMGKPSAIANFITDTLRREQINALAILANTNEATIKAFRNSTEPGIAVVVKKLELGFDTACDWLMILRESENNNGVCQKVGRAVRLHKPTFEYEKPRFTKTPLQALSTKKGLTEDEVMTEGFLELLSLTDTLTDLGVKPLQISGMYESMKDSSKSDFLEEEKVAYILKPKGMGISTDMMGIDLESLFKKSTYPEDAPRFDPDFLAQECTEELEEEVPTQASISVGALKKR